MTVKTYKGSTGLKVGDPVHYQPRYIPDNEFVNGIVKEIPTHTQTAVQVVYNCNNDWLNYTNYTSELTFLLYLKPGWRT